MKYEISRASGEFNHTTPPCKAAFKERNEYIFKSRGRECFDWFVVINTLEELQDLIKEVGDRLLMDESWIVIADDYLD